MSGFRVIFSIADHIKQIKRGEKTQTRRKSGSYMVGKKYSIQPRRRALGIPDGRIRILDKRIEQKPWTGITYEDAKAEGGYTPDEFDALYENMYKGWRERYAYTFRYEPRAPTQKP